MNASIFLQCTFVGLEYKVHIQADVKPGVFRVGGLTMGVCKVAMTLLRSSGAVQSDYF